MLFTHLLIHSFTNIACAVFFFVLLFSFNYFFFLYHHAVVKPVPFYILINDTI